MPSMSNTGSGRCPPVQAVSSGVKHKPVGPLHAFDDGCARTVDGSMRQTYRPISSYAVSPRSVVIDPSPRSLKHTLVPAHDHVVRGVQGLSFTNHQHRDRPSWFVRVTRRVRWFQVTAGR